VCYLAVNNPSKTLADSRSHFDEVCTPVSIVTHLLYQTWAIILQNSLRLITIGAVTSCSGQQLKF
jgi:hypothetical protein